MKNIILTVMITTFCSILISGCDFNDDYTAPHQELNSMNGTWKLTNIKNDKINQNYNLGDITWEFDSRNSRIIVENKSKIVGPKDFDNLESGDYRYSISTQVITQYITIDGTEIGLIKSNTNRDILIINGNKKREEIQTGGYILTFRR